jgi:hypothetical protein
VISASLSLDAAEIILSGSSASGLTTVERETLRTVCVSGMQQEGLPEGERIRWARSALAVIDLQHKASDDPRREAANAAAARAYVIRYLGQAGQDDIGNPTELARYVLAHIHEAREDVASIAPDWRSLPKDQIRELRRIKNLLAPLKGIEEMLDTGDPAEQEALRWLVLLPDLP